MDVLGPERPNHNCHQYNTSKQSLCFILSRWISWACQFWGGKMSWQLLADYLFLPGHISSNSTPPCICFQGLIQSVYGYTARGSVTPVPRNSWFMRFPTLRSTAASRWTRLLLICVLLIFEFIFFAFSTEQKEVVFHLPWCFFSW